MRAAIPPRNDTIIRVAGVSKKYKLFDRQVDRLKEALHPLGKTYHTEFWALRDVSFEVAPGECVGILGRNGSGKSTLLQIIAGVLKPTAGEVSVTGAVSALLELGAGFNTDLTGRENIIFSGAVRGMSEAQMQRLAPEIERFADIGAFIDQPVRTYSSGMFVRLAFAVAISAEPRVLVVDEALAVGDAAFQRKCYERIAALKQRGTSILFVSHDENTMANVCDRALVMDGGHLVFSGSVRQAIGHYHGLVTPPPTEPSTTLSAPTPRENPDRPSEDERTLFLNVHSDDDRCSTRRSYNPSETRLGNGRSRIVDYLLAYAGEYDPSVLSGRGRLDVSIKVRFQDDVSQPIVGFGIFTADNVKVYAQNTAMMKRSLTPATRGDVVIYTFAAELQLTGGDYFLNMGVDDVSAVGRQFSDVRRGIAHLRVPPTPWCEGVVDLGCGFEEQHIVRASEGVGAAPAPKD